MIGEFVELLDSKKLAALLSLFGLSTFDKKPLLSLLAFR